MYEKGLLEKSIDQIKPKDGSDIILSDIQKDKVNFKQLSVNLNQHSMNGLFRKMIFINDTEVPNTRFFMVRAKDIFQNVSNGECNRIYVSISVVNSAYQISLCRFLGCQDIMEYYPIIEINDKYIKCEFRGIDVGGLISKIDFPVPIPNLYNINLYQNSINKNYIVTYDDEIYVGGQHTELLYSRLSYAQMYFYVSSNSITGVDKVYDALNNRDILVTNPISFE